MSLGSVCPSLPCPHTPIHPLLIRAYTGREAHLTEEGDAEGRREPFNRSDRSRFQHTHTRKGLYERERERGRGW